MNLLSIGVVLGLLVGALAQVIEQRPPCDSLEAEEAALAAQDYLNAQHTHGYKYALNRIEDIKIITKPDGDDIYFLEVDLLETDCHALDPTPVANCTVRPKVLTSVEGDCDVVLKKVGGVLTVTAFKCKTDVSTEDLCLGCPTLLPLNHTNGLDLVHASLVTFNNMTVNTTYTLLEVGRLSEQIVSGGPIYLAEYIVIEATCIDDVCVTLNDTMAARGICIAKGLTSAHTVDCRMFSTLMPFLDANSTAGAGPAVPPVFQGHTGSLSHKHGLKHHKLTRLHDPNLTGLLSAESAESAEVVPVVPAVLDAAAPAANPSSTADPAPAADPVPAADPMPAADASLDSDFSNSKEIPPFNFMMRDAPVAPPSAVVDAPVLDVVPLVPVCPGKIRFFD